MDLQQTFYHSTPNIKILQKWFMKSPGQELLIQEQRYLKKLFSGLFGCYLLQIGWGQVFASAIANTKIRRHIILEEHFALIGNTGKILGQSNMLPIASDSMDVVFLPHTLEFVANPHQVILEADRVLIPGGHLIVFGFNPWSLWGIWCNIFRNSQIVPWWQKSIGRKKVEGWLKVQGFQIEQQHSIIFLPPLQQRIVLRQLQQIEPLCEYCLPLDGAVYAIRAIKRVSIFTPLKLDIICNTALEPAFKPSIRSDVSQ
ncbi:hypothetical protein TI05_07830 [Achromatium sp. WMS3]|nr:hypothetical protein TI05_07830 [Achromatium sp. WMS3]